MNEDTRQSVESRIRAKLDSIIERRIRDLPTDTQNIRESNPFGSRLVPLEIWKASKFERSFVTSFGQGVYEQIAYDIARGSGAYAENQHVETVSLNSWQEEAIGNLLASQRGRKSQGEPDWDRELRKIIALDSPRYIEIRTCFDLYVKRDDGSEEYYSMKTVTPNLDQTEIAKRDMLRISAAKSGSKAYLALPYNPNGEGNRYEWSVPKKLFNMNDSRAVLIGGAFWNAVGKDETTFIDLLEIFQKVGDEYRNSIKRDFLDI